MPVSPSRNRRTGGGAHLPEEVAAVALAAATCAGSRASSRSGCRSRPLDLVAAREPGEHAPPGAPSVEQAVEDDVGNGARADVALAQRLGSASSASRRVLRRGKDAMDRRGIGSGLAAEACSRPARRLPSTQPGRHQLSGAAPAGRSHRALRARRRQAPRGRAGAPPGGGERALVARSTSGTAPRRSSPSTGCARRPRGRRTPSPRAAGGRTPRSGREGRKQEVAGPQRPRDLPGGTRIE